MCQMWWWELLRLNVDTSLIELASQVNKDKLTFWYLFLLLASSFLLRFVQLCLFLFDLLLVRRLDPTQVPQVLLQVYWVQKQQNFRTMYATWRRISSYSFCRFRSDCHNLIWHVLVSTFFVRQNLGWRILENHLYLQGVKILLLTQLPLQMMYQNCTYSMVSQIGFYWIFCLRCLQREVTCVALVWVC